MLVMSKETKKFSAFKLFYDEIIYKDRVNVAYDNIAKNLRKIKELTMDIRKFPKIDLKEYHHRLEKNNKKMKEQLYEIAKKNKALYEYYYIIYKTQVEICTEKIEDMPFVIYCSFYEDYRLDNKTVEELESSRFTIPKYTSLEKKKIRDTAKTMTRFEYFVKLINESKHPEKYRDFINKTSIMMSIRYLVKETKEEFLSQIDFGGYKKLFEHLEDEARLCEDYEIISDKMGIAYKRKFINWSKELDDCIIEHYDKKYKEMRNSREMRGVLNEVNDISYEEYQKIIENLIREKNDYMTQFFEGKFTKVESKDDSFTSKFKENLINTFFDPRYINEISSSSTADDYVSRAMELYSLADDLGNQIFEKIIFDAGHSPVLRRNNDVRSSIIEKMYELYDPLFLLTIYDKTRNGFEGILNNNAPRFIQEYNFKLTEKKLKYNYHGPLPSPTIIMMRVNERKKSFIIDNCQTELKSKYTGYDTRNYDLSLVAKGLYINDMVDLYDRMKQKISSYTASIKASPSQKRRIMVDLQEFIAKDIYSKLNVTAINKEDENNKYRDICHGYLNEKCLFLTDSDEIELNNSNRLEDFIKNKREYNKTSKWANFISRKNIKTS